MTIEEIVREVSLRDQPSDFAYWQTKSCTERLDALEQVRREYHRWVYGGEPSFQRVYTIVKRSRPSTE